MSRKAKVYHNVKRLTNEAKRHDVETVTFRTRLAIQYSLSHKYLKQTTRVYAPSLARIRASSLRRKRTHRAHSREVTPEQTVVTQVRSDNACIGTCSEKCTDLKMTKEKQFTPKHRSC